MGMLRLRFRFYEAYEMARVGGFFRGAVSSFCTAVAVQGQDSDTRTFPAVKKKPALKGGATERSVPTRSRS